MNCYSDVMEKAKAASNAEELLARRTEAAVQTPPYEGPRQNCPLSRRRHTARSARSAEQYEKQVCISSLDILRPQINRLENT